MIRVRQGDTIELTLRNNGTSHMAHSIDLHAALGPGGGAAFSQVVPGQSKTFTFSATTPGVFVYHGGTPMIAEHMANGMYGLILVEPKDRLPHVEHEYYFMQGEIYTTAPKGKEGFQQFSAANLMAESPQYFVFNGGVNALTTGRAMKASVGETVRVFFGNAGPNQAVATHAVGEIFTKVYEGGSLTSTPATNVQTTGVAPGAAAVLEFAAKMPGKFALMDHSIARMSKGLMALIQIDGLYAGEATAQQVAQASAGQVSGLTKADEAESLIPLVHLHSAANQEPAAQKRSAPSAAPVSFDGCLTIVANDGKALLKVFQSTKIYRLEAQPLLFSQNAGRFVHVTGKFGSVTAVEDDRIPSFVVDAVDQIAPNCNAKISAAQIRRVLVKRMEASKGIVTMSDMAFLPQTLVTNVGEKVFWRNTAAVTHNVVADRGKAVFAIGVKLPAGVRLFASSDLLSGQSYSHTFTTPGTYRYVCTLHETTGMKGVIVVEGPQVLRASK